MTGYSVAINSGGGPCPRCHETLEFRVASGALEIGVSSFSGPSVKAVLNGVEFPFPGPAGAPEA